MQAHENVANRLNEFRIQFKCTLENSFAVQESNNNNNNIHLIRSIFYALDWNSVSFWSGAHISLDKMK